jgi:hypothetical protein
MTDYSTTHGGKKKIEKKEKRMNEWAPLSGNVGHFMKGYQRGACDWQTKD